MEDGNCRKRRPKSLPDDLLLDIFSRLHVKSLLCIGRAAKSSRRLISGNHLDCGLFSNSEFFRGAASEFRIIFTSFQSRPFAAHREADVRPIAVHHADVLPFLPPSQKASEFRLRDCHNGLLLVTDGSQSIYLCNPATGKWARLPEPGTTFTSLALASNNIIAFQHHLGETDPAIKVFSLATGKWRRVTGIAGLHNVSFSEWRCARLLNFSFRFTFCNDMLYVHDIKQDQTFAIDIERKICRMIARPVVPPGSLSRHAYWAHCLGVSRGLLHHAVIFEGTLFVYVLDHGQLDSYALKHKTSLEFVARKFSGRGWGPTSVFILALHPKLDVIFLRVNGDIMASYDLSSGELKEIGGVGMHGPTFTYVPCYSDNLELYQSWSSSSATHN